MKNERQILTYWEEDQNAVTHMESSNRIHLAVGTPQTIMWWMNDDDNQEAYVEIIPNQCVANDVFDVYFIDRNDNTVWCEMDAVNPVSHGRIFHCGEDIYKVVVVNRRRKWWRFWRHGGVIIVSVRKQPRLLWTKHYVED